jgi:Tol biopolymer transport system component
LLSVRADGSDVQLAGSDDLGFDAAGTSLGWTGPLGEATGFSILRGVQLVRSVRFRRGFSIAPCSLPEGAAPQVSPNGHLVAYADGAGSPDATDLYLLPVGSKTPPRRLMHVGQGNVIQHIVWSPNSRTLAVTRTDGVYLLDIERPRPRFLTGSGGIAWSPDGRTLAVAAGDLELIDSRGRLLRRLVTSPNGLDDQNGIDDVSWAPSQTIAFIQNRGDDTQSKCSGD